MAFEIREMEDSDWEYVRNIYNQGILKGTSTFQAECPTYEQFDKARLKECRYVVTDNERVCGWCTVSPTSARECYRGILEVSLYVDKDYHKKGLGRMLIEHLCKETEKRGYWCLYSVVLSINVGSIELMKKCGFREIGYREKIAKDRFGNWQNTTLLERRNNIY